MLVVWCELCDDFCSFCVDCVEMLEVLVDIFCDEFGKMLVDMNCC